MEGLESTLKRLNFEKEGKKGNRFYKTWRVGFCNTSQLPSPYLNLGPVKYWLNVHLNSNKYKCLFSACDLIVKWHLDFKFCQDSKSNFILDLDNFHSNISKFDTHVQSLAVKLAICQLSKNKCCYELGQHKSVVNTSFKRIYSYF